VTPAGERNPKELLAEAQGSTKANNDGDGALFLQRMRFCQSVLNCMANLHCEEKVVKKNIREDRSMKNIDRADGAKTVPVLVVDGKPIKGSEEISQFLVGKFL
jgi:glutaredoxin